MRQGHRDAFIHRFGAFGPYHYKEEDESSNPFANEYSIYYGEETIKWKYLQSFLQWSKISLNDCIDILNERRTDILRCYDKRKVAAENEIVVLASDDFVIRILLDACFIIEHLRRFYCLQEWQHKDPIFSNPWLAEDVARDFGLLENQLPFFVLESLYEQAPHGGPSFLEIACSYFCHYHQLNVTMEAIPSRQKVLHFTDLLRKLYLSPPHDLGNLPPEAGIISRLPSATKLQDAGVKFQASSETRILEFRSRKAQGVLIMPCLELADRTETIFRNLVAFELSYYPFQAYMTSYLFLLRSLIKGPKDVDLLVDKGILINFSNDSTAAVAMINNLCLNLPSSSAHCYRSLCGDLIKFYKAYFNEDKVTRKENNCGTNWKTAFTIAAILLLLTLIQTVCSFNILSDDTPTITFPT